MSANDKPLRSDEELDRILGPDGVAAVENAPPLSDADAAYLARLLLSGTIVAWRAGQDGAAG